MAPEHYSHIDFHPTEAMSRNAQRAIEHRDTLPVSQQGVTEFDATCADCIMKGSPIEPSTVRRMQKRFNNLASMKSSKSFRGKGKTWQAWMALGGNPGREWVEQRVFMMNAADTKLRRQKNNSKYQYGSTQLNVAPNIGIHALGFGASIDPDDLHEYGVESEPHVTVLYGILYPNHDEIARITSQLDPIVLEFGEATLFEKDEYDVLKVDVTVTPELQKLRDLINERIDNKNPWPEFHAHLTIAYLKPGTGRKYIGENRLTGMKTTVYYLTVSDRDGARYLVPFGNPIDGEDTTNLFSHLYSYYSHEGAAGEHDTSASPPHSVSSTDHPDLQNADISPAVNSSLLNISFTVNGATRSEYMAGKEYLILPVVSAQEQVMNGELILMEEFSIYPRAWDDSPVCVNHPTDDLGNYISGRSPDVPKIGRVYQNQVSGTQFVGEIWLDVSTAEALGGNAAVIVSRARNNEVQQVSWGWWRIPEPRRGEFQGVRYNAVARYLVPDHLAILTDEQGACSVADGCGTMRGNTEEADQSTNSSQCNCGCGGSSTTLTDASASNPALEGDDADESKRHTEVSMSKKTEARDGEEGVVANATAELTTNTTAEVEESVETAEDTAPAQASADSSTPQASRNSAADAPPAWATQLIERVDSLQANHSAPPAWATQLIADVTQLKSNAQAEAKSKRDARIARLAANEQCPLDESALAVCSDEQLTIFEQAYKPADFSANAFSAPFGGSQETKWSVVKPQALITNAEVDNG